MTTIATQTDESIGELFRFRDVAEDTCSAEAVTDALMTQIEEKMDIIKTLEERVEYQDIQLKKYIAIEEDKGLSNRGPKYLEEYIEEIFAVSAEFSSDAIYWEEAKDDLQDEYDDLEEERNASQAVITMLKDENEGNKQNLSRVLRENRELREWVDRNQDEINRLRDVIEEEPPAPQVPWFHPLTKL